jgi:hypothetical protein
MARVHAAIASVADLNAHVTALDNEKLVSLLTFAENDTACSYSECLNTITRQEAKACLGHHCELPNHKQAMLAGLPRLLFG